MVIKKLSLLALALITIMKISSIKGTINAAGTTSFGDISYGYTTKHHYHNGYKQDLSGAAIVGNKIVYIDDGGTPLDNSLHSIRVVDALEPRNEVTIPLPADLEHRDLEGITSIDDRFIMTASLSVPGDERFNRLTKFHFEEEQGRLKFVADDSVDLRNDLVSAMRQDFDDDWIDRFLVEPPKTGGLNIEAISRHHTKEKAIVWGLRSPLYDKKFGNPANNPGMSLTQGKAIVVWVAKPFKNSVEFNFATLDLEGKGIRGMEWIPKLDAYIIIAGPAPKGSGYTLWSWNPEKDNNSLSKLSVEGFDRLCRPETMIQLSQDDKNYLVIYSEESGGSCVNAPYTYIKAEIVLNN